jgi:amino acid transporter
MFLFVVTKILILFLLLFLFQSLGEVAVLMSLLVFISEPHSPIRKRSKHRGKGRRWVKVEGSPLGPTVKASCLAPH